MRHPLARLEERDAPSEQCGERDLAGQGRAGQEGRGPGEEGGRRQEGEQPPPRRPPRRPAKKAPRQDRRHRQSDAKATRQTTQGRRPQKAPAKKADAGAEGAARAKPARPRQVPRGQKRLARSRSASAYTDQAEALQAEADPLAADREPGDIQFDDESGEGDTLAVERERDLGSVGPGPGGRSSEIDHALAKHRRRHLRHLRGVGPAHPEGAAQGDPVGPRCASSARAGDWAAADRVRPAAPPSRRRGAASDRRRGRGRRRRSTSSRRGGRCRPSPTGPIDLVVDAAPPAHVQHRRRRSRLGAGRGGLIALLAVAVVVVLIWFAALDRRARWARSRSGWCSAARSGNLADRVFRAGDGLLSRRRRRLRRPAVVAGVQRGRHRPSWAAPSLLVSCGPSAAGLRATATERWPPPAA